MESKSLRAESRLNWITKGDTTYEEIKMGALLRIADASELMARSYEQLIKDRDYYKGRLEEERIAHKRAERRIAALRGHLKRAKRKLAEQK
ncbi:MAG: hypothetical protein WAU96_12865 [Anaerolineae bacterium]